MPLSLQVSSTFLSEHVGPEACSSSQQSHSITYLVDVVDVVDAVDVDVVDVDAVVVLLPDAVVVWAEIVTVAADAVRVGF